MISMMKRGMAITTGSSVIQEAKEALHEYSNDFAFLFENAN